MTTFPIFSSKKFEPHYAVFPPLNNTNTCPSHHRKESELIKQSKQMKKELSEDGVYTPQCGEGVFFKLITKIIQKIGKDSTSFLFSHSPPAAGISASFSRRQHQTFHRSHLNI